MSTPLETMRHSAAHVLAAAVLELWPDAKLGVGPAVENGFYYDIDPGVTLTPNDLARLEKRMGQIISRNEPFRREDMPLADAITFFRERKQDLKVELLNDLLTKGTTAVRADESQELDATKPDMASVYWTGKFVDLCRGPHVATPKEIGVFKLTKIAGAYWRGDARKRQLQRVYGVVFPTKEELEAHLKMQEEAEKRDHKKLGPQLDLFVFSDLVGAGLPLWTPKGTLLRNLLDGFVWKLREEKGYVRVEIPHITRKELYEKSGHWAKYQDDLFKVKTRENHEFAMKPMNCPHHTQIYARQMWSYRELPQRYANTTMCYRDEQTGELSGISRARAFTQDDAHVFCRMDQVKKELEAIWSIVHKFYGAFGMKLKLRLSLRDMNHPEKYLGDLARWDKAEDTLREIAKGKKTEYFEGPGEAAFYGPKLDFMAVDSIGRTWQVATIQLDMVMPERFDLYCVNEKGEHERVVMIHAAIMGSIERFLSVLIEHVAGAFPTWLSPVQAVIVPVAQGYASAAKKLMAMLTEKGIRAEIYDAKERVGYNIRKAIGQKVPYMLVVGEKEKSLKNLTVRVRGSQTEKKMSVKAFVTKVTDEIAKRK